MDGTKSSAGSVLLVRNRMIGWPTLAPCRHTSSTKFGVRCVPNSRLKMSMQVPPQGGVAAAAESIPTVLTPPTRVTVAAAAKTLLLKDMDSSLLGTTAVPCARLLLLASWRPTLRSGHDGPSQGGNGRPDR